MRERERDRDRDRDRDRQRERERERERDREREREKERETENARIIENKVNTIISKKQKEPNAISRLGFSSRCFGLDFS